MRLSSCLAGTGAAVAGLALVLGSPASGQEIPKGNHFECYQVVKQPDAKTRTVVLVDQFGKREVQVGGMTRLCNPVAKTFGGVVSKPVDDKLHLVCYRLAQTKQAPRIVRVINQFGQADITVEQPLEVCLPSSKKPLK